MTQDGRQLRFDDGKDPAALRTIGEVAAAFDLRQHVLRYWEQQFPMLRDVLVHLEPFPHRHSALRVED